MKDNFYLLKANDNLKNEISKIANCNKILNKYGININEKEVMKIAKRRTESLKQYGRIELGDWIIPKIIKEFSDSPYVSQKNFSNTICELIDIFYYYKNETKDLIGDEKLIEFMKKYYDELAHGDLDYLSSKIMEKMKKNILENKKMDFEIIEEKGDYDEF